MGWDFNKAYILDKDFEVIERDGKYLYIDYENVNWFKTNATGNEILNLCDGVLSLEELMEKFALKYQFDKEYLKVRSTPFIDSAVQNGILIESGREKQRIESANFDFPEEIYLSLNGDTCSSCICCDVSLDIEPLEEKLVKFLEQIPIEKRKTVVLSGAEPLLYKGLSKLAKSIKSMGFKLTLITDGTADTEMFERILPDIDALQVPIASTENSGVLLSLKKASESGLKSLTVSFAPNTANVTDMPNVPKFALENGATRIHIDRCNGKKAVGGKALDIKQYGANFAEFIKNLAKVNKKVHYIRETKQFFEQEKDKKPYIQLAPSSDFSKRVSVRNKRTSCSLGTGIISVNYDGNIYACAFMQTEEYKLGRLDEGIDSVIVKGKSVCEYLSVDNSAVKCNDCNIKYFCGGGCRACALQSGDALERDPMCAFYKSMILETMWRL